MTTRSRFYHTKLVKKLKFANSAEGGCRWTVVWTVASGQHPTAPEQQKSIPNFWFFFFLASVADCVVVCLRPDQAGYQNDFAILFCRCPKGRQTFIEGVC